MVSAGQVPPVGMPSPPFSEYFKKQRKAVKGSGHNPGLFDKPVTTGRCLFPRKEDDTEFGVTHSKHTKPHHQRFTDTLGQKASPGPGGRQAGRQPALREGRDAPAALRAARKRAAGSGPARSGSCLPSPPDEAVRVPHRRRREVHGPAPRSFPPPPPPSPDPPLPAGGAGPERSGAELRPAAPGSAGL